MRVHTPWHGCGDQGQLPGIASLLLLTCVMGIELESWGLATIFAGWPALYIVQVVKD